MTRGYDCCRHHILEKVRSHRNVRVMFVESICDNEELLEANYRRCVSAHTGSCD